MFDVWVVIVTMNHRNYIRQCIDSILDSVCRCTVRITVVDNCSVDGTKEILKGYNGKVQIYERDKIYSCSSNNNVVLKNCDAKYFLVLNPDTILPNNGIAALFDFMESHPEAGACAPKLIFPDASLQLSCRRFPTPMTFLLRRTPLRYFLTEEKRGKKHLMTEWSHDQISKIDWALDACVIYNGKAIRQIGYYDEGFRLYVEEIDVCYRLWKNGWTVLYNPEVEVIHDHQRRSDKSLFSRYSLWHYQSMLRYVRKHGIAGFRRPGPKVHCGV